VLHLGSLALTANIRLGCGLPGTNTLTFGLKKFNNIDVDAIKLFFFTGISMLKLKLKKLECLSIEKKLAVLSEMEHLTVPNSMFRLLAIPGNVRLGLKTNFAWDKRSSLFCRIDHYKKIKSYMIDTRRGRGSCCVL
jgi:hypothetical protein